MPSLAFASDRLCPRENEHVMDSSKSAPVDGIRGEETRGEQRSADPSVEGAAALSSPGSPGFPIVGIGASAGGLEALEELFDNMPINSGMAFVVVQHLSPDFKSVMDELLARHTRIPIHRVVDNMPVEPNAIYLIPPKKEMIVSAGKLLLSDKDPSSGLTLPIDIFFRSLAQDAGPRSIGVVLSGTGSDGSRGICDIHEAGGFVVAQDVDSARFDGMPKSAAETGIVDVVARPEQIPATLLSYTQHPCAASMTDSMPTDPALLEGFDAIFQLLRKTYDIDFSYYKRTTVARRVQRRLSMNQITDLEDYIERLREDSNELNLLYKDLLIGVTKFFRDTEAYQRLQQDVLPQLLVKVRPEGELRIWSAGCATGEEAYSLAILVHEQLEQLKLRLNVKIFATDVHRTSLDFASAGVYSDASLSEVSPERLARYFTRVKSGYHVAPELRQMIVFAPHNIVKDAPFTKIDLITCRNLLIYLEPPAQKKAISLFHFALNTGGVMLMGPSESPGDLADEFEAVHERWKIYRKRRDKRLPPDMRLPLSVGYIPRRGSRGLSSVPPLQSPPDAPLLRAYDELLKDYAPPSLLVNERRELVQSFSGASAFLRMRDGRPSNDVFDLVVPDLKIPLATAVQQAAKKRATVTFKGIRVTTDQGAQQIKLTVKPIPDRHSDSDHFLISLEAVADARPVSDERDTQSMDLGRASQEQVHALESELRYMKENLQATVEEMETSNEELQATNEELVASNEELQSTNEELHSVNEELYTVNAEYQKKIGELTEMTADMDNLLHSTDVGVIFLDPDLCIRKYTPKIAEVFHLLPLDIGRRIESFAPNIDRAELLEDLKRVLRDEIPFEAEVHGADSKTFLLRILPYRAKTKIDGVVVTLIDISQLKQAESKLRLMSKVFLDGADPIVIEDLNGHITDVNAEAERMYGWTRDDLLGKIIGVLIPPEERERARQLRTQCIENGGLRNVETIKQSRDGELIPVLLALSLLTDQSGQPVAVASIAKNIAERKRAEDTAREAVRKRDHFLAMLSHELRNPLSAALNATYLLDTADEKQVPPALADACRVIQRQTLQVARLLDDLLDVSRVTQGKIDIRRQVLDLTQLVSDAVDAVRSRVETRGQQLTVDISSEPVCIEGDPARLLQIQENLLTNATKYTQRGGTIHLSLHEEGNEAVFRVRDNGQGVPGHMLESIFELFVQSEDTLDRSHGGMGLGLTLVKTLVELHDGTVTAHSPGPGQGCEFVVRLPLVDQPEAASCKEQTDRSPGKTQQRHLVLVEDNDDSRQMLAALLKLEGHQVSVAKDGEQGLEMILKLRPDAAIVDIGLPKLSGYDVAKEVRRRLDGRTPCLIALTGYGRSEDREAARSAGFDAHLVKPLKPLELTHILIACTGQDEMQGNWQRDDERC